MTLILGATVALAGCGSMGSSKDFSGEWYMYSPNESTSWDASGRIYKMEISKTSDHMYTDKSSYYEHRKADINVLNEAEYSKNMLWTIGFFRYNYLSEGPNRAGILPQVELTYTWVEQPETNSDPVGTERDGVYYMHSSGRAFTLSDDGQEMKSLDGTTTLYRGPEAFKKLEAEELAYVTKNVDAEVNRRYHPGSEIKGIHFKMQDETNKKG